MTVSVTIHDVAKHAGVGIGTVSSVLNNSRPVNETTRQKVLDAVAKLDFIPNPSGRRLSMGKTHTIAVVIPFFTLASQIERLRGVMSIIAQSEYDIGLYSVETVPQRNEILQRVPRRGQVDGLLIFSLKPDKDDFKRIKQRHIPTVLIESAPSDLPGIYLDDVAAARQAVDYLIELGHRKIGYVGDYLDDPFGTMLSYNRYLGYCQALETAGVAVNPEYHRQSWINLEEGRKMGYDLLTLPDPPTAIFAFCDEMALGILEAARELNLDVPGDLSIIGYDDIRLAHFAQLTTVRQNLFDTGVQGINLLLDTINDPQSSPACIEMPTKLIVRQTTAPPRQP